MVHQGLPGDALEVAQAPKLAVDDSIDLRHMLFGLRSGHSLADTTAGGLEMAKGGAVTPSLFIAIEPDGSVKLTCHRSEMGQQLWTSIAQIMADELEADWGKVEIVQAIGHPRYGDQNTDGSRSIRWNFHRLQVAGNAAAHVRIGWLRSVANVYHAFAIQSFAAELAHAAGRDQKDFLLELIGPPRHVDPPEEDAEYDNYGDPMAEYPIDTGRLANVTREAAALANWGRKLEKGRGLGIAAHRSFLSDVATVVEVEVDGEGRLTIPGVW